MRYFSVVLVCISLFACSDNSKLTRSKAESLISSNEKFKDVIYGFPSNVFDDFLWGSESGKSLPVLPRLHSRGLVTFTARARNEYTAELTEKGNSYKVGERRNELHGYPVYMVRMCERVVTEITGIEQQNMSYAKVFFLYKTINSTPFGETAKNCDRDKLSGSAELTLFDDGWRVKNLKF
jgi:hypothetical protein